MKPKIDLMLLYVEYGTQLTLTYGDIDEPFYDSLIVMFKEAISEIKKLKFSQQAGNMINRLEKIVNQTKNISWGYGDALKELFTQARFVE